MFTFPSMFTSQAGKIAATDIEMFSEAVRLPSVTWKLTFGYVPVMVWAGVQVKILVEELNEDPDGRLEAE
jgi:hypothetical protein